jgi:hypothetical protein
LYANGPDLAHCMRMGRTSRIVCEWAGRTVGARECDRQRATSSVQTGQTMCARLGNHIHATGRSCARGWVTPHTCDRPVLCAQQVLCVRPVLCARLGNPTYMRPAGLVRAAGQPHACDRPVAFSRSIRACGHARTFGHAHVRSRARSVTRAAGQPQTCDRTMRARWVSTHTCDRPLAAIKPGRLPRLNSAACRD